MEIKVKNRSKLLVSLLIGATCVANCSYVSPYIEKPSVVGSLMPSSKRAAKFMTKYVDVQKTPKKILEVGGGTGPFTRRIVKKMHPGDHLDVIELLPEFCRSLEDEFGALKNVAIHCVNVLDWHPDYKYDSIVSALPFNAFDAKLVTKITSRYVEMTKPKGVISFFEYLWFPAIKKLFLTGEKDKQYRATRKAITDFVNKYEFDRTRVHLNLTPMVIFYLRVS